MLKNKLLSFILRCIICFLLFFAMAMVKRFLPSVYAEAEKLLSKSADIKKLYSLAIGAVREFI